MTRIHEKNYVHKDIKPNNILLDSDGNYPNAKIGDMGIAICHKNKGTRP